MRTSSIVTTLTLTLSLVASALTLGAAEKKEAKAKPYPLITCVVSGEKLDSDPAMKSHVFVQDGQEVKLCCKNCVKDFKKDTAGYMKKIADGSKTKK